MLTAEAAAPRPRVPNGGRFLSSDGQERWRRITSNVGMAVGDIVLPTWDNLADSYPQPDTRAINRRIPGMSFSAGDLTVLGPRAQENDRSAAEAAYLEIVLAGLRKL